MRRAARLAAWWFAYGLGRQAEPGRRVEEPHKCAIRRTSLKVSELQPGSLSAQGAQRAIPLEMPNFAPKFGFRTIPGR